MERQRITVLPGLVYENGLPSESNVCGEMFMTLVGGLKLRDIGYVELVDYMGEDLTPASAARVSYDGTKKRSDIGLLRYLWRNEHSSPFEMVELKFHVVAPIFVFRQWHRHRTASINELSGRYATLKPAFYVPPEHRVQAEYNKQGSIVSGSISSTELSLFKESYARSYADYQLLLNNFGVAKEVARTVLPVATYSKMVWKIDLKNLFHFLKLRMHDHAQKEIKVYAVAIAYLIKENFPNLWSVFETYTLRRKLIDADTFALLKKKSEIDQETLTRHFVEQGMSRNEAMELVDWISENVTPYDESLDLMKKVENGHLHWYEPYGFVEI